MTMSPIQPLIFALTLAVALPPPPLPVTSEDAAIKAQSTAPEHLIRATRVDGDIRIDGRLEEPDWQRAELVEGFVQVAPHPGAPVSQRTVVRVLYDDRNLYVGMRMFDDEPDAIAAQLARRGTTGIHSDWAGVAIDSYHDRRTAFGFAVSPAGVQRDMLYHDDTEQDDSWEAVWEAAATVDSLGWTAEFRIPFSQLRFSPPDDDELVWGVNFARVIAREEEQAFWAPVPPTSGRFVSLFGTLYGLEDLVSPRRVEINPYLLSRLDRAPSDPEDPFGSSGNIGLDGGLDLSYGLGPNLTLTATLNPDFGQVEVDPAVVNLSAFETFFPERRPFFLEGVDIFRFGITGGPGDGEGLFYTRRIGRSPQGAPPAEAVHAETPSSSRVLGAIKLSGRVGGAWSVGVLNALTGTENTRFVDAHGEFGKVPVEPRTNYGVLRVTRDFRGGSSALGGIITTVNRDRSHERLGFLPSEAYAGGIDGRLRFRDDNWQLRGWIAASHVGGSSEAIIRLQRAPGRYFQRPDAEHVDFDPTRTSLTGWAGDVTLSRISGERWRGGALLNARTPGFEVNDVGFLRDRDRVFAATWFGLVSFAPGRFLREWSLFQNLQGMWTWGTERGFVSSFLLGTFQTRSGWGGQGQVQVHSAGLDPVATRGGPSLHRPSRSSARASLHTDRRRSWYSELNVRGTSGHEDPGHMEVTVGASVTARPSPRLEVSVGPSWSRNRDPAQYVGEEAVDGGRHFLFGAIDQTTVSMDIRANWTFTPDVSLELFARPFVSVGHYSDFRRTQEPRARDFPSRFHTFAPGSEIRRVSESGDRPMHGVFLDGDEDPAYTFADPGFRIRSLRGNAVLRWEFRPGSTLYFVWQQDRSRSDPALGRFDLTRDARGIVQASGEHVFLIKASYWLGR